MTKHELKLKRRRERYLLKKDNINRIRREKYLVARKSGLGYKEARKVREHSIENISETYENIRIDTRDNIRYIYVYIPVYVDYEKVEVPKVKKVSERTKRRRLARSLGYTPEEANKMRDMASDTWDNLISDRSINAEAREDRWANMSSRNKFDDAIIEACEAINLEEGYEINSRYGWGVYYFWHLYGGKLEDWKEYVLPDMYYSDMLGYRGNASTYLFRSGKII